MSKVEMDMTEFKALEENKRLLEESLQREKDLNDKLDKANKEKIKALEDAQSKVVVKKTQVLTKREYRMVPKDYHTFKEGLLRLYRIMNLEGNPALQPIRITPEAGASSSYVLDQLFKIVHSEGQNQTSESYELSKSLEDWKGEQMEELKKKAEAIVGDELKRLKKLEKEASEAIKENDSLNKMNARIVDQTANLIGEYNELVKSKANFMARYDIACDCISQLMDSSNMFNRGKSEKIHSDFKDRLSSLKISTQEVSLQEVLEKNKFD